VLYLDADNRLDPNHVESILAKHREPRADIVTSRRALMGIDGSYLAICLSSDGEQFCDTNCLAVFRPAFAVFAQWSLMDPLLHAIDDRVI